MIRLILILLEVAVFAIVSLPLLLLEWLLGKINPMARDMTSLRIVQAEMKIVLRIAGTHITVKGWKNVPKNRAVLYICNHRSYLDTLLTYAICPGRTGYVAKHTLESYPILSYWMKFCYCLFLNRDDLRQGMQTIQKAIDYIGRGISICIFPEGTRNKNESELDMLPFHEGSFRVATRSGAPIIPVSICNSREMFEAHFPKVKSTHVIIEYGTPIDPSKFDRVQQKHLGEYTRNIIRETLIRNEKLL
ncbi:MAG: 1-acyl-sn-glycerol-3-phosphate acyltransferase [Blautia sp.]|nr:1-acyl-sn-glycerol-3-phosphate acyltransferase [Blautia sp.]